MDKKCPYCGSEDDFFESDLIEGIVCNQCGVSVNESRARGYARGFEMGEEAFEKAVAEVGSNGSINKN